MRNLFGPLSAFLLLTGCSQTPSPESKMPPDQDSDTSSQTTVALQSYSFPYQLNEPDAVFVLPQSLVEISGLGFADDSRYLIATNDEVGKVFFLDKETGAVAKELPLKEKGDFEGIEMADGKLYLVKSNGNIYEVVSPGTDDQEITLHKTWLKKENDVEGLGYDAKNNRLLLACKAKAGQGESFHRKRAVYAFDLALKELEQEPAYLISLDEIEKWAAKDESNLTEKLAAIFNPSLADDAFAPSAIAIHPLTEEVYLLSSVGKILVVLETSGAIRHIEPLDPHLHSQPEGICFDSDGTLFISNEGKGGSGKLMRLRMR